MYIFKLASCRKKTCTAIYGASLHSLGTTVGAITILAGLVAASGTMLNRDTDRRDNMKRY